MAGRLKAVQIRAATCPAGRAQVDLPDGLNGLALRVFASGRRTWIVRYRTPARVRRTFNLGRFPDVPLADARAEALRVAACVREGRDPAGERRAQRVEAATTAVSDEPNTVDELAAAYFKAAAIGRHNARGRPKAARTLAHERSQYAVHVGPWFGGMAFAQVTRAHVRAFIDAKLATGLAPASINGLGALVRALFTFAITQERLAVNPAARVASALHAPPRERVLTDDELAVLWSAVRTGDGAPMDRASSLAAALTMVTLARPIEVIGAQMREFDLDAGVWELPAERMKSRRPHVVPLSAEAIRIVHAAHTAPRRGPFVFESARANDGGRAMTRHALTRAFKRLVVQKGLTDVSLRDVRRTGATLLARSGVTPFIVSKVLGHADTGGAAAVTAVYNRYNYVEEKRSALEAWALHLRTLGATGLVQTHETHPADLSANR